MNNYSGMGQLTADPQVKKVNDTVMARFTLAINRRFKGKDGDPTADFIPCVVFGKTAEVVEKYCKKGMRVAITGRIQTGSYTNKEGQKVYTTDVIVETLDFAEKKSSSSGSATSQQPAPAPADGDGFMNIPDSFEDEELPFN